MPMRLVLVLGCVVLLLGSCGGGDGGGDESYTVACYVVAGGQGAVTGDDSVFHHLVDVGDYSTDEGIRGIYRFDITSIPAGVTVTSARLVLQVIFTDGDPFDTLGTLWVNHVDIGVGVDADDYDVVPITAAVDSVSEHPGTDPFSFDVLAPVTRDAGLSWPTCDFRLEFSEVSDEDGSGDFVRFPFVPAGGTDVRLVVTYRP